MLGMPPSIHPARRPIQATVAHRTPSIHTARPIAASGRGRLRQDLLLAVVDVVPVQLNAVGEADVLGAVQIPAVELGHDAIRAASARALIGLGVPALDRVAPERRLADVAPT